MDRPSGRDLSARVRCRGPAQFGIVLVGQRSLACPLAQHPKIGNAKQNFEREKCRDHDKERRAGRTQSVVSPAKRDGRPHYSPARKSGAMSTALIGSTMQNNDMAA